MAEEVKPAAGQGTPNPAPVEVVKPVDATAVAKPGEAAAAVKPAEANPTPAAAPVVPDKYDLKLPEGSPLKPESVEKIASFAKERGLSNEQAQAILQRDHEAQVSFAEANKPGTGSEWKARVQGWEQAALADKEIGGSEEALKANAELGRRVVTKFFPESVSKFLSDTGFGSNPDIIRGFAKLGKMMSDDQLVIPGGSAGNKRSMEDIFYGDSKKQGE